MKLFFKQIVAISIAIFLFTSCTAAQDHINENPANSTSPADTEGLNANAEKLKVYTSFYPMYDFAKKMGGDKIQLTNLLPYGEEIHHWEPTPADIVNLENADIFIYSGVDMEHWVTKVLDSIKSETLVIVEASDGLTLLENSHEGENEHEAENQNYDPHVWLSIINGKNQMEAIKNALVKADPTNKDYYEENFQTYAKDFDSLDKSFKEQLSPLPNKEIVVSHDAFGYLCHDYDLTQIGLQGLIPDSEPDPARMAEVIELIKKKNIKVVFFEELASPKVSEILAKETGATTNMLSTLEALSDEQLAAGEDYLSVMKQNLEALKSALQ